jgi:transcriptional regulator with XRE-family HTH domain
MQKEAVTEVIRWILDAMNARGWTQAELARRSDISTAQISQVLAGNNRPGFDFYEGIARAFGVPLEEVLRRAGILRAWPAESVTDDLQARLRRLPAEDQERVLAVWQTAIEMAEQMRGQVPPV